MIDTPEVSIVIPVFNEGDGIRETVAEVRGSLGAAGITHEVILVDDGSNQASWKVAEALARAGEVDLALRFSRNFGKEAAILCGLSEATGESAAVMDADLEHPPEVLVEMVRRWRAGDVDVVEAVKRDRGAEPWHRRWAAGAFYRILRYLSGFDLEGASDFKLLSRRAVRAYLDMPESDRFFRALVAWIGMPHDVVPFDVPQQRTRPSRWTAFRLIKLSLRAIAAFSYVPLHLVTGAGALTLVVSVLLGIQTLWRWATRSAVEGFTTVILVVLFSASVTMLSLGIVGEYLAHIYNEVKRRPPYVVLERSGRG